MKLVCLLLALALTSPVFGKSLVGKETLMKSVTNKVLGIAAAAGFTAVMVFSQPAQAVELGAGVSYDMHHKDAQVGITASHDFSGIGIAGSIWLKDVKQVKEPDSLMSLDSYDWTLHADKSWSLAKEIDLGFSLDHVSYADDFVLSDAQVALKYKPIEVMSVDGGMGLLGEEFTELDRVFFVGLTADVLGLSVSGKRYFSMDSREHVYDAVSIGYGISDDLTLSGSYHRYGDDDARMVVAANFTLADLLDKRP